jgi:hypothetical protein
MMIDSWRCDLLLPDAGTRMADQVRTEFETALNRFASDIEARLKFEFHLTELRVSCLERSEARAATGD